MEHAYTKRLEDPLGLATMDVIDMGAAWMLHSEEKRPCFYITRMNVPAPHRRKGIGRELAQQLIADADKEGVILRIDIGPYGRPEDMGIKELYEWYVRLGFVSVAQSTLSLIRYPHGQRP